MSAQEALRNYAESYVKTFETLSAQVRGVERATLFPSFLRSPRKIKCTISDSHGAGIAFLDETKQWSFEVVSTKQPIEEALLPNMGGDKTHLINRGVNNIIENLNLMSKQYFDDQRSFVESLTNATNFVIEDCGKIVDLQAGDNRLIDVGLAWMKNRDRPRAKRIHCVWLFASNNTAAFSIEDAEARATDDYSTIVSRALGGVPVSFLKPLLQEYQKRINQPGLKEEEMQQFLAANLIILEADYKRVFTKGDLRSFRFPEADFLVQTSKNRYVLVEIETPSDEIFTKEDPPNPSKELRAAETQIQGYLSWFKNNVLFCKTQFPDIAVENIQGLIIIGRSTKLTDKQKDSLQKLNASRQGYEVTTYDELFSRTNTFLENFAFRFGRWKG